jgi:hypothetical protein
MQAGTARIHALESDNATLRAVIATLEQQTIIVQADLREAEGRIERALGALGDPVLGMGGWYIWVDRARAILRGERG